MGGMSVEPSEARASRSADQAEVRPGPTLERGPVSSCAELAEAVERLQWVWIERPLTFYEALVRQGICDQAVAPLPAIAEIWDDLPNALRNTLTRHSLTVVQDILTTSQEEFAELRCVGTVRVREFLELQGRLASWLEQHGLEDAPPPRSLACPSAPEAVALQGPPALPDSLLGVIDELLARVCGAKQADGKRNVEMWRAREGLEDGRVRTLDEVADVHGVTRERVRQIVTRAGTRVRSALDGPRYAPVRDAVAAAGRVCWGVAPLSGFARILREEAGWREEPSPSEIRLLGRLLRGTPLGYAVGPEAPSIVVYERACERLRDRVREGLRARLEALDEGVHILDLRHELAHAIGPCERPCESGQRAPIPGCADVTAVERVPEPYLRAHIVDLKPCPLDGDDRLMPLAWTTLRHGRDRRSVVRAALATLGAPAHFRQIANRVRAHNGHCGGVSDQYVHNCLINGDDCVNVGRGLYGLAGWGLEKHATVADRVVSCLQAAGGPRTVAQVLADLDDGYCTEGNVRASIQQNPTRLYYEEGLVGLAAWRRESVKRVDPETAPLIGDDGSDWVLA